MSTLQSYSLRELKQAKRMWESRVGMLAHSQSTLTLAVSQNRWLFFFKEVTDFISVPTKELTFLPQRPPNSFSLPWLRVETEIRHSFLRARRTRRVKCPGSIFTPNELRTLLPFFIMKTSHGILGLEAYISLQDAFQQSRVCVPLLAPFILLLSVFSCSYNPARE